MTSLELLLPAEPVSRRDRDSNPGSAGTVATLFAPTPKAQKRVVEFFTAVWSCGSRCRLASSSIEGLVAGTELAQFINRSAGPQRTGVLSSLGMKAKSFRLLRHLSRPTGASGARTNGRRSGAAGFCWERGLEASMYSRV